MAACARRPEQSARSGAVASGKRRSGKPDKQRKEEEERRRQEEEEARARREQEEAEKRETERLETEERERLEAKERERRDGELWELSEALDAVQTSTRSADGERRARAKWERYMRCDGTPDPSEAKEINTFVSLWALSPVLDVTAVLNECGTALDLIEELESVLADAAEGGLGAQAVSQHRHSVLQLQRIIATKLDQASHLLLKRASSDADLETGNLQAVVTSPFMTLMLWGNLQRNPRFKGYEFAEEECVRFELPKPLAASPVAVRFLWTRYDHLTHLCAASATDLANAPPDLARSTTATDGGVTGPAAGPGERPRTGDATAEPPRDQEERAVDRGAEEPGSNPRRDGSEPRTDGRQSADGDKGGSVAGGGEGGVGGPAAEGDTTGGAAPPQVAVAEEGSPRGDEVDLRQQWPLGGVLHVDLLRMPPQPALVGGWTLTQEVEGGLQAHPYRGVETATVAAQRGASAGDSRGAADDGDGETCPPLGVSLTVPPSLLVFEPPQVACWDPHRQCWVTTGVSEVTYEEAARRLAFRLSTPGPVCLLADAHVNMPYHGWKLRPAPEASPGGGALFTVMAAFTDVEFEIQAGRCRVCALPEDGRDPLATLRGVWMSPDALRRALQRRGLNVFPERHADRFVAVNVKDAQAESRAYEQMALLASTFSFSWSRWNATRASHQLVMQVQEHGSAQTVDAGWGLALVTAGRSCRLRMAESAPAFSEELADGAELHSTLCHALLAESGSAPTEMRAAAPALVATLQQLLASTRVLSYA